MFQNSSSLSFSFSFFSCVWVCNVYACICSCSYVYRHIVYVCVCRPNVNDRNIFPLLFYHVLWGGVSQPNLELVFLASLLCGTLVSTLWDWNSRWATILTGYLCRLWGSNPNSLKSLGSKCSKIWTIFPAPSLGLRFHRQTLKIDSDWWALFNIKEREATSHWWVRSATPQACSLKLMLVTYQLSDLGNFLISPSFNRLTWKTQGEARSLCCVSLLRRKPELILLRHFSWYAARAQQIIPGIIPSRFYFWHKPI